MNIPDEAVEAAARVLYTEDHAWADQWEDVPQEVRERFRARALVTIDAAAPHIKAQALREASDAYPLETAYGGAEHAVLWLKQRAETIEAVPTGAASVMKGHE